MRKGLAVWVGGLASLLCPAPLRAATVQFHTDGCPAHDFSGLERLAELEFRHRSGPAGARDFSVIVTCQGPETMLIVAETASQTVRMRELELQSYALEARVRLIVLAAAELASELSETLGVEAPPPEAAVAAERAGASAPKASEAAGGTFSRGSPQRASSGDIASVVDVAEPVAAQTGAAGGSQQTAALGFEPAASLPFAPRRAPLDLSTSGLVLTEPEPSSELLTAHAVASTRFILGTSGRLLGGGARLTGSFPRVLAWSTDILFEEGTLSGRTGAFDVRAATLGGVVGFHGLWGGVELTAGAGLRLGLTRTHRLENGESVTASTPAPWGWPMAAFSLAYETLPSWVVSLSAETGYTLLPVNRGAGTSLPALRGVWMSAQLGVGFRP